MKNITRFLQLLEIIALAAIIGFSMAACFQNQDEESQKVITIAAIPGVTVPVTGGKAVSAITPTEQYTGKVEWEPEDDYFASGTQYTATIILYAKEGYTEQGVPANFFTVAGATATNDAETRIITAVFPKTDLINVTFSDAADFGTWLKSQPPNTTENPYIVKLDNISSLGGDSSTAGSVGKLLNDNIITVEDVQYRKYVSLDLSSSTITSIGEKAFADCKSLTGIIMPTSVTSIEKLAFNSCSNLTSVTIPDSVTRIYDLAFYSCISLTGVNIPKSVNIIGSGVFTDCISLTEITVAPANSEYTSIEGVLYRKDKTFLWTYPAGKPESSFTIPDGVTNIYSGAFDGNQYLTIVNIPASVTYLSAEDFFKFEKLAKINVAAANPAYSSDNGVLYNKAKTTLICFPLSGPITTNGTFTIPNTVNTIGEKAFGYAKLTSITIPATVTKIEELAFHYCIYLTSVKFEGTITDLSYDAFYGDLSSKYTGDGGGIGTYKGTYSSRTWTKQ